jgi:hypothetical protein
VAAASTKNNARHGRGATTGAILGVPALRAAPDVSGMVRREVAERFLFEHQFFDFWFRFHGCLLFFIRCLLFRSFFAAPEALTAGAN